MPIKILLADKQPVVFDGLKAHLSGSAFQLLGMVADISKIPKEVEAHKPDLVIAESRYGGQDAIGALERMSHDPNTLRVIIFSEKECPTAIARAVAIGANDYVLKTSPLEKLVDSIDSAMAGKEPPEDSLLKTLKTRMRRPRQTVSEDIPLTKRELQVLQHVALGLSNREVGKSLGISVETAKEHVQNILRKLDVNDRTKAAVWAVKRGLA